MLGLLRDRHVLVGFVAVMLLFMGQFALFTYLRPFLEQVTGVGVSTLSLLLLVVGVAGFVGTSLIGRVLGEQLHLVLALIPGIMAGTAVLLAVFGTSTWVVAGLLAVWGLVGTAAPVAWWTWLTRTLPEDAEAGGGLIVAVVQLGITAGATLGGLVFDAGGPRADVLSSAAVLGVAAAVAFGGSRSAGRR